MKTFKGVRQASLSFYDDLQPLAFKKSSPAAARTGSKTASGPEGGRGRRPRPRQGRGGSGKEGGRRKDGKWGREGRGRAKKEGAAAAGSNHTPVRRRPPKAAAACSPTLPGSTIGACGLNFSVRNGKRCGPAASPPLVFPGPHTTGAPYAGRENFEMKSQT